MNFNLIQNFFKAVRAILTQSITIECDRIPYRFYDVPLKKILNWFFLETSIFLKTVSPWGYPTHLMIEPTTHCNLKCALCPVTEGMKRPSGHMAYDTFKKIINQTGDFVFLILLWDWGEPFLNPRIYDMISYAKKRNIKIVSSTNGHVFTDMAHAEKLVRSGIDSIIFAVDGISQKVYERYRAHGELETVIKGIRNVVTAKHRLRSETPLINFRFIAMKHNEHEMPFLKQFCESLEVDVLTIKTLNPYSNDTYGSKISANTTPEGEFLPRNPVFRRFEYKNNNRNRIRARRNQCKNLWNNPAIHWDGTICSCTYDYDESFVFGKLKETGFKNIWFGNSYRNLRRQFRSNWAKIPICAICSYAFKGGSCIDETIAETIFLR